MSQFILILFWFAIMAVFARFVDVSKTVTIKGKQKQVVYWWFAVLVFVPIIYMAVFRDARWEDTGAYIGAYRNFPETMSGFASAINAVKKDKAFYAVGMLTKILISKDYRVFFFLLATFQAYCVIKLLQEHSPHFLLSVFVFWASTDCVSWMFNGIRQFTAVCICLLATNWVLKKKYIPAVLTILIASFFHQTALLMIPVFLVASGKMANYKTVIVIILVIFAVAYVDRFTNLLDAMLEDTQYTNVVEEWTIGQDDGTSPIRVLVYSVPTILMLLGRKYIKEANDPIITLSANMAIVSTSLYVVSMFTSGIYMGRLPIYASLFATCILLPWEIDHIFNRASSQQLTIIMIVCYLGFYYYQMHLTWGLF